MLKFKSNSIVFFHWLLLNLLYIPPCLCLIIQPVYTPVFMRNYPVLLLRRGTLRSTVNNGLGIIIGYWAEDTRDGHGKYTYVNGDEYEGEWCNNVKHGKGVYINHETGSKVSHFLVFLTYVCARVRVCSGGSRLGIWGFIPSQ